MKRSIAIAALALIGGSALVFADSGKKVQFDATAIDANTVRTKNMDALLAALAATHRGTFISPFIFNCADEAACESKGVDYYKRVGVFNNTGAPTASYGSMEAFIATNGFSPDPRTPAAGELRAVYFNRGDLGFGRDMHCKSHPAQRGSPAVSGSVHACYVTNYGDNAHPGDASGDEQQAIAKAKANQAPIATVAMETFVPDTGGAAAEVQFFVYDTGGSQTDHHTPQPNALTGPPLTYAILDNDATIPNRHKANPGVCMNCHGGDPGANTLVDRANFLAFDAQQFGYDLTSASPFSETAQRETFRKLNAFVKATKPPAARISEQIHGWYGWCGGVATAGCHIDDQGHPFTPQSWQTSTIDQTSHAVTKAQVIALYQDVARKYCRTCHLARFGDYDVQDESRAGRIKVKLNPAAASSNMPNAERTFNDHWRDAHAQSVYNAIWP